MTSNRRSALHIEAHRRVYCVTAYQVTLLKKGEGQESNQKPRPIVLNELLTQKLLSLDNLDVTGPLLHCHHGWEHDVRRVAGEDRVRRKTLINRIHDLCSQLDEVDKTES